MGSLVCEITPYHGLQSPWRNIAPWSIRRLKNQLAFLNFAFSKRFPSLDSVTINYKDSRWVGAWWLGFIATGTIILLSSIPFWFLPKSLPKQGQEKDQSKNQEVATEAEQDNFLPDQEQEEKEATFREMAKGTTRSYKRHGPWGFVCSIIN